MFVFGSPLFGGVLGSNPTIAGVTGVNDNLPMQYDFRSVYASILKDWFCVNATDLNTIMLQNFQQLRIVNSPTCITPTHEENVAAGISLISNYPNPFSSTTTIEFQTTGGHTMVQVFDTEGRLMATPVDGDYVEGKYKVYFNAERLPSGIYYGRLQNGAVQQVKTMLKVR
jgi:Secretion system C-terminal sorting domain